MKGKRVLGLLVFLVMLLWIQEHTADRVSASMKSGDMITLTQDGQVIDSIVYNGITVEALYTNVSYASNDTTYSCAAFVKKFYESVYGVKVYNLLSPSSIPLIYDNAGSFIETSNPKKGDIIRDNTRTHWAIVKSISGNTITVIQQSYRRGTMAWVNCTIERTDPDFSYFTYDGRIPDANQYDNQEEEPSGLENQSAERIMNGTYQLIHASTITFIRAGQGAAEEERQIRSALYDNSINQQISMVNHGDNQYSLQFLSDLKFLNITEEHLLKAVDILEQKFIFIPRENGAYTISPAQQPEMVVTPVEQFADGTCSFGISRYTGDESELWYLSMVSPNIIPIVPEVSVSKKTLYTGYKNYSIELNRLIEDAAVAYSSADTEVAEVDLEGVIKPVGIGKTVITIEIIQGNDTYLRQIAVTVKAPYVKIKAAGTEIKAGEEIALTAKRYGTDSNISWSVSKESLAEINRDSGLFTAKKVGIVTVRMETEDGLSAVKKIKITN